MTLENFLEHLDSGKCIYAGSEIHRYMCTLSDQAMRITSHINNQYNNPKALRELFSKLTGRQVDNSFMLFTPFYTDCGKNILLGRDVFINSGCHFQDQGGISIGDGSQIGHNVTLATLNHGLSASDRSTLYPAKINIGRNVWIGSGSTVLAGVTIGDNAIVGAGSVVTRDVAANTIVAGVPARVIREVPYVEP